MKIVRYILDDRGIVLIVDQFPAMDQMERMRADVDAWAQVVGGRHFPVLVLPGDENTKVDDLRSPRDV